MGMTAVDSRTNAELPTSYRIHCFSRWLKWLVVAAWSVAAWLAAALEAMPMMPSVALLLVGVMSAVGVVGTVADLAGRCAVSRILVMGTPVCLPEGYVCANNRWGVTDELPMNNG